MKRRLNAIKKRFWSLLILLLFVALKTTHTEERSVHTNSEICIIQLGSKNTQFNSKQIIQILQTIVIDYFSTHSYKVNIYNVFDLFLKNSPFKLRRLIDWYIKVYENKSQRRRKVLQRFCFPFPLQRWSLWGN